MKIKNTSKNDRMLMTNEPCQLCGSVWFKRSTGKCRRCAGTKDRIIRGLPDKMPKIDWKKETEIMKGTNFQ